MSRFTILVGTMTSTAELVAEEIQDEIGPEGHDIEVEVMDALDASIFETGHTYLICTSTYGQGDVPDNAMKLYKDLQEKRPDLAGIRYGVYALGDSTYDTTYCHGGERFDELLADLGAARVGEMGRHNASAGTIAEEECVEWARDWVKELATAEQQAA